MSGWDTFEKKIVSILPSGNGASAEINMECLYLEGIEVKGYLPLPDLHLPQDFFHEVGFSGIRRASRRWR